MLMMGHAQALTPKTYVDCLTDMHFSQNEYEFSREALQDANSLSERFLGKVLSFLPKGFEQEVLALVGATVSDLQNLRKQASDPAAVFGDENEAFVKNKFQVALNSYYSYHPHDDRFIVLLTPESKVFYIKVSDKGLDSEKVNKKIAVKDDRRNYYFSIKHDPKCSKNCDNYLWLVDTAALSNPKEALVKTAEFVAGVAVELKGAQAINLARSIWQDEIKYGLSKIVGVEKAQKLPGDYVLPDPNDTNKYNKEKFVSALKACERNMSGSTKDKELLVQAIALLR